MPLWLCPSAPVCVQVRVLEASIDDSHGDCGNMIAAVGSFAIEQGKQRGTSKGAFVLFRACVVPVWYLFSACLVPVRGVFLFRIYCCCLD